MRILKHKEVEYHDLSHSSMRLQSQDLILDAQITSLPLSNIPSLGGPDQQDAVQLPKLQVILCATYLGQVLHSAHLSLTMPT
jgi:hypothetical protein